MYTKGFQQYKENSVDTMTPGELLLALYDELVKRLTRAEIALNAGEYGVLEESVDRSVDIIHYLDATLDRSYPISMELARMYEFFCYELARVRIGRNKVELERVKRMCTELRDAFRIAAQDNSSGK